MCMSCVLDQMSDSEKLDLKLSDMMGQTNIALVKPRVLSEEEKARKAAIIAQYDNLSDGEYPLIALRIAGDLHGI